MELQALGCTKQKINQFQSRNIYTTEDLLKTLPKKYLDFRNPKLVKQLIIGEEISVVLKIIDVFVFYRNRDIVRLVGIDSNGDKMYITYFNMPYMAERFDLQTRYIFCGKVSEYNSAEGKELTIVNPTRYSKDITHLTKIIPVYRKINQMSETYYAGVVDDALKKIKIPEYLEPSLLKKYQLINQEDAIKKIHKPETMEDIDIAQKRILFDDLFSYSYMLIKETNKIKKTSPFRFAHYDKTRTLMDSLPYQLTEGQRETLLRMAETTREGKRINAVVMGDVGCGKTLVAELMMLMAVDEGYQSALLAPTVVLAEQHYKDVCEKIEPLGVKCALLTSQTKAKEKKRVLQGIKDGSIHIIVGTHILLNPEIGYKSLALTIIDEEHRFGVEQRNLFKRQAVNGVHTISMSATPIPRTLALSVYGRDTQIYKITTLPEGRKPIKTVFKANMNNAFKDIETQLVKGRQAYIVCPLIEASSSEKMSDVKSSEGIYQNAKNYFGAKGYKVAHINARMKQSYINETIEQFSNKEFDILVSTTIIEVGINIPNATVMCIANAERFGLAQLHQLRGRVGRGNEQGYCLLETAARTPQVKEKILTLCRTNDGFEIAQKDLELRGCGDFIGTMQTGDNKYVSLLIANEELNTQICEDINDILADPDRNKKYQNHLIDTHR